MSQSMPILNFIFLSALPYLLGCTEGEYAVPTAVSSAHLGQTVPHPGGWALRSSSIYPQLLGLSYEVNSTETSYFLVLH
jgi:hypothetical protein